MEDLRVDTWYQTFYVFFMLEPPKSDTIFVRHFFQRWVEWATTTAPTGEWEKRSQHQYNYTEGQNCEKSTILEKHTQCWPHSIKLIFFEEKNSNGASGLKSPAERRNFFFKKLILAFEIILQPLVYRWIHYFLQYFSIFAPIVT